MEVVISTNGRNGVLKASRQTPVVVASIAMANLLYSGASAGASAVFSSSTGSRSPQVGKFIQHVGQGAVFAVTDGTAYIGKALPPTRQR